MRSSSSSQTPVSVATVLSSRMSTSEVGSHRSSIRKTESERGSLSNPSGGASHGGLLEKRKDGYVAKLEVSSNPIRYRHSSQDIEAFLSTLDPEAHRRGKETGVRPVPVAASASLASAVGSSCSLVKKSTRKKSPQQKEVGRIQRVHVATISPFAAALAAEWAEAQECLEAIVEDEETFNAEDRHAIKKQKRDRRNKVENEILSTLSHLPIEADGALRMLSRDGSSRETLGAVTDPTAEEKVTSAAAFIDSVAPYLVAFAATPIPTRRTQSGALAALQALLSWKPGSQRAQKDSTRVNRLKKKNGRSCSPPSTTTATFASGLLDSTTLVNMIFLDARSDALEAFAFSLSTLAEDLIEAYEEQTQQDEGGIREVQLLTDVSIQLLDVVCLASRSSVALQTRMGSPASGVFPACLELLEALLSICASRASSVTSAFCTASSSSPKKKFWLLPRDEALFFLSCFHRLGELFHLLLKVPDTGVFASQYLLTLTRAARELVHLLSVVPAVVVGEGHGGNIKAAALASETVTAVDHSKSGKNVLNEAIKAVKNRDKPIDHESSVEQNTAARDELPFAAHIHSPSASPLAEEQWMGVLCQYTRLLAVLTRRSVTVFQLVMEDENLEAHVDSKGNLVSSSSQDQKATSAGVTVLSQIFSSLWTSPWGDALEAGCMWWVALARQTADEGHRAASGHGSSRKQEEVAHSSRTNALHLTPKEQQAVHLEQLSFLLGSILETAPTVVSRFREALTWGKPLLESTSHEQDSILGVHADSPFSSVSPVSTAVTRCWRWIICVCPRLGSAMVTSQREVCMTFVKMILEFPNAWLKHLGGVSAAAAAAQPSPIDPHRRHSQERSKSSRGRRRPSASTLSSMSPHAASGPRGRESHSGSTSGRPGLRVEAKMSPKTDVITWITELTFTLSLAYVVGSVETQVLLREWLGSSSSSAAGSWLGLNDVTRAELQRRMQRVLVDRMDDSVLADILAIRLLDRHPPHRSGVAYGEAGVVMTGNCTPDTLKGLRRLLTLSLRDWLRRDGSPQHQRTSSAAECWKGDVVTQTRGYGPQPPFLLHSSSRVSDVARRSWAEYDLHHEHGHLSGRSAAASSISTSASSSSSSFTFSSSSLSESRRGGGKTGAPRQGKRGKRAKTPTSGSRADERKTDEQKVGMAATPRGHLYGFDAPLSSSTTAPIIQPPVTTHSLFGVCRVKSVPAFSFLQARHRHHLSRYRVVARARSLQGNFMHQTILTVLRLSHHCSVGLQTRRVNFARHSTSAGKEAEAEAQQGDAEGTPREQKPSSCADDRRNVDSPSVLHGKDGMPPSVIRSIGVGGASPYETEDRYPFRILSSTSLSPSQEAYALDTRSGSVYVAGRYGSSYRAAMVKSTALDHPSSSAAASSWLQSSPPTTDGKGQGNQSGWLNTSHSTKWNTTMNGSPAGEVEVGSTGTSPLPRRPVNATTVQSKHLDSTADISQNNPWARKHKKHDGRQWDVEFLQPEDILTFFCGSAETREADVREAIAATAEHVKYLYEQRRLCPVSLVQRRCLIQDLYVNVYPKVYMILQHIQRSAGFSSSGSVAPSSAPFHHFSSIAVRRLLEKEDFTIHSGNLLEVFDTISHCDASLPF